MKTQFLDVTTLVETKSIDQAKEYMENISLNDVKKLPT